MNFLFFSLFAASILTISIPNINQIERTVKEITHFSDRNPCISAQINQLKTQCSKLTDQQKAKTALILTNCLLQQSKKETVPCSDSSNINDCLSQIKGDSWTSFTNFYVHVDSLCYYYTSILWEERTGALIGDLSSSSAKTQSALEENFQQTRQIVDIQKKLSSRMLDSINLQQQLRTSMKIHRSDIEQMSNSLGNTISNLQNNVNKHYKIISQVFNSIDSGISNLSKMQYVLLGEIEEGIGSIVYYFLLLSSIFVLSLMCKGVRQCFLSNVSMVLGSILMQRLLKYLGLGGMSFNIRILCLVVIVLGSIRKYRNFRPFEVRIIQDICRMNKSISERMGTERISRIMRNSKNSRTLQKTW